MSSMDTSKQEQQRSDLVGLNDEDGVKDVLTSAILGLWDVVNNLTRLRPSRRERYRVTIFGSARARPGSFAYDETKRVASTLAELGCDIITGGGPGLMQAANEGAASGGGSSRSVAASTSRSSKRSTRSSAWRSSTAPFSRGCTSSS